MGAAEHASVNLGVVVRIVDGHDFEVGVLQQVIERDAALFDICVLQLRRRLVANSRREVSTRLFGRVLESGGAHRTAVDEPHHPDRPRGSAAHLIGFFQDERFQSLVF